MGEAMPHEALLAELLSSMTDGNDLAKAVRATLTVLEEGGTVFACVGGGPVEVPCGS
jgi:hypothetical protein